MKKNQILVYERKERCKEEENARENGKEMSEDWPNRRMNSPVADRFEPMTLRQDESLRTISEKSPVSDGRRSSAKRLTGDCPSKTSARKENDKRI
ncbi:hypothetical protein KIN20_010441 [Parelaphostrongylus tenuis]|uniref:Uncharacterized protein n=1 Tax=Parelaphostrongylus tenuis TaxID=148309 RepID=A0AAD5QK97_PARTN|nr:hypothetical protein KIN20_010441 [Parelaphostrongylus tenuis]